MFLSNSAMRLDVRISISSILLPCRPTGCVRVCVCVPRKNRRSKSSKEVGNLWSYYSLRMYLHG